MLYVIFVDLGLICLYFEEIVVDDRVKSIYFEHEGRDNTSRKCKQIDL